MLKNLYFLASKNNIFIPFSGNDSVLIYKELRFSDNCKAVKKSIRQREKALTLIIVALEENLQLLFKMILHHDALS